MKNINELTNLELEVKVTNVLREFGIPANLKGYKYLRIAIVALIREPEVVNSITKVLYPKVAEEANSTPSRVERAIRHAIESCWRFTASDVQVKYFGCVCSKKPTNSQFLATIADKLRLELASK